MLNLDSERSRRVLHWLCGWCEILISRKAIWLVACGTLTKKAFKNRGVGLTRLVVFWIGIFIKAVLAANVLINPIVETYLMTVVSCEFWFECIFWAVLLRNAISRDAKQRFNVASKTKRFYWLLSLSLKKVTQARI